MGSLFQMQNMKLKDKRLKIMNEILNGIKVSSPFQKKSEPAKVLFFS